MVTNPPPKRQEHLPEQNSITIQKNAVNIFTIMRTRNLNLLQHLDIDKIAHNSLKCKTQMLDFSNVDDTYSTRHSNLRIIKSTWLLLGCHSIKQDLKKYKSILSKLIL